MSCHSLARNSKGLEACAHLLPDRAGLLLFLETKVVPGTEEAAKWASVWENQKKWLHDLLVMNYSEWIQFATLLQTLRELLGCCLGTPGVLPRWAWGGAVAECQSLEVGSSGTFFFPVYSDWRNLKDSRARAKQTVNCFPSNLMMAKCVWTYDERTYAAHVEMTLTMNSSGTKPVSGVRDGRSDTPARVSEEMGVWLWWVGS